MQPTWSSSPWRRLALGALVALATVPASGPARAAPCCMSATAFGMGRLLIWEDFALGLRTTLAPGLGTWDEGGRWRSFSDYSETEWRSEVWGLVGLGRRASVFLRVPALVMTRSAGADSELGGGLGDLSAGVRYELLAIGELVELPAIALTLAVLVPTGRSPERAKTPLAVDVTGRGAWVLSLGLSLERTSLPWFVRLDLGTSVPLPQRRDDLGLDQRLGISFELALSGGLEIGSGFVLSLVPRLTRTDVTRFDEEPLPDTDRLDIGLGLAASWRLDDHFTLQAAIDLPLPIDGLGQNQPGRIATTLGLRYGSF